MSKKSYTPTYSAEFRERAIQLFKDPRAEYASDNKAYRSIAEKLGCSGDSLRTWCLQAARDAGQRAGPTSAARRTRSGRGSRNLSARCVNFGWRAVQRERDPEEGVGIFCSGAARRAELDRPFRK